MSTFRQGIIRDTWGVSADAGQVADAVLAMPEMQAIRKLLFDVAEAGTESYWYTSQESAAQRAWLRRRNIPESVIEWVLP